MPLTIQEVRSRKELKTFIYLPKKFHGKDPNWLPPIWMDELELFDKKRNNSFQYNDTIMLLAYRNGEAVGRIMGIISLRYNEINNENHGRFCFIECGNDQEVFHALLSAVEEWTRAKGMTAIVGPLGFSDKDPEGFQIEGFDYPSVITTATNFSYMPDLIEKEGYIKKKDMVNYHVPIPDAFPSVYEKIFSRVNQRQDIKVVEFKKRKEIKPYIIGVLELMNQVFMEIYGFVPLTDQEKMEFAKRYLYLLTPDYVKIVTDTNNTPIGFAIGMPDLSEGIKRAKGRLLPFGLFHIIRASHKSHKLVMMLGGIKPEYRSQGIDTLMGAKMLESAIKNKMTLMDSHLVLEENLKMRAEYERLGGTIVKRFRVYIKVF